MAVLHRRRQLHRQAVGRDVRDRVFLDDRVVRTRRHGDPLAAAPVDRLVEPHRVVPRRRARAQRNPRGARLAVKIDRAAVDRREELRAEFAVRRGAAVRAERDGERLPERLFRGARDELAPAGDEDPAGANGGIATRDDDRAMHRQGADVDVLVDDQRAARGHRDRIAAAGQATGPRGRIGPALGIGREYVIGKSGRRGRRADGEVFEEAHLLRYVLMRVASTRATMKPRVRERRAIIKSRAWHEEG